MATRHSLAASATLLALLAGSTAFAQSSAPTAPDLGKHTAHAPAAPTGHDMPMHGMDMHGSPASMDMRKAMMQHDMSGMKMTGDADRDFAAMMVMHHEQGIRMMDIEIKQGKNAALKAMATRMKAQQAKEIAELKKYR